MCSTPSTPSVQSTSKETVATPTYADAASSKASSNTRQQAAGTQNRNIKTSSRGLLDDATTNKKGLLGE